MPLDRNLIGRSSGPYEVDVEKGQLIFFAKATKEENPIYFDEAAAKAAGHRAIPAPPTFTFSLAFHSPLTFDVLGLDMRRVLHGEQTFTQHATIYAGDRMTLETRVLDVFDKKGGTLEFLIQRTSATNQDGQLCTTMDVTTVVRNVQGARR